MTAKNRDRITIQRMDDLLIVADDLEAAKAFFAELEGGRRFESVRWLNRFSNDEGASYVYEVFPARRRLPARPADLRDLRRLLGSNGSSTTTWSTRSPCSPTPWSSARARGCSPARLLR